jgi:hypothetical protein
VRGMRVRMPIMASGASARAPHKNISGKKKSNVQQTGLLPYAVRPVRAERVAGHPIGRRQSTRSPPSTRPAPPRLSLQPALHPPRKPMWAWPGLSEQTPKRKKRNKIFVWINETKKRKEKKNGRDVCFRLWHVSPTLHSLLLCCPLLAGWPGM